MITRRSLLKLPPLGLLACSMPIAWCAPEARRRALIVGIDVYTSPGGLPPNRNLANGTASGSSASGSAHVRRLFDLDGAVNDAELIAQLLKDRLGFPAADVVLLENGQASRERILAGFRSHLIESAAPGDVSLFYFAGHGSQVRNLASDESDMLDETLVPADAEADALDIRDKELARLYRTALAKQIQLTVVLDSCHSGGMSRGGWNGGGKVRFVAPAPAPVNDPPDRDASSGKKEPDATSLGMLFLAAAREDQSAGETTVLRRDAVGEPSEIAQGVFTAALAQVLQSSSANQSVEEICTRVQALMAGQGSAQVPVCGGLNKDRRGLLGQPAGLGSQVTVAVESASETGSVRLRGGSAMGLTVGCTLVRTAAPAVRVTLTRVDLGISEAKVVRATESVREGSTRLKPGDLLQLETWVAPPQKAMSVYFPKDGPNADALMATARELDRLGHDGKLDLVFEPSPDAAPTHILYWRKGEYALERFPHDGVVQTLGPSPAGSDILRGLGNGERVRLWPILPPDRQMAAALRLGQGTENAAIRVGGNATGSVYLLACRLRDGRLEYNWCFKDIVMATADQARLPLRTDWSSTPAELTSLAVRLARIYGWINLTGPSGGDPAFPYKLVLERPRDGQAASKGQFKFGDEYKFFFEADPRQLREAVSSGGVAKRYVYVFLIDAAGNAQCFFPLPSEGNIGNLLPRSNPPEARIPATTASADITIEPPAGTDNYFCIASAQPLDPQIFTWSGVRTVETKRGAQDPLELLFNSTGESTRGARSAQAVPATWSIQSFAIRSGP
jgi:hypothetical protein